MAKILQLRRGPESRLPILQEGEIIFTTDTHKLFVGTSSGPVSIDSIDVNEYVLLTKEEIAAVVAASNSATAAATAAAASESSAAASAQDATAASQSLSGAIDKLAGIEEGAEVNVNADWDAVSGDAQILNKPTSFPPSSHAHDWDEIGEKPTTFPPSEHGFHVPSNGTTNDKKVLTASAVDGTFTWEVAAPTGKNTDGGGPSSVYLSTQSVDGGMP